MVSGNAAPQKKRKFSKLSLAGFILSLFSLICFASLLVASDRFKNSRVAVGIGTAVLAVALTVSLIFSVAGFITARSSNSKGSPFGLCGLIMSSVTALVLVCILLTRSLFSVLTTTSPTYVRDVPLNTYSAVLDGVPRIFGEAVFLPCTIAELKQKGFDTDYSVTVHEIHMWPKDDRGFFFEGPYINCYLEYDSYDYSNKTASDDSIVVGIKFQEYNRAELDFHNISFDMTDEDIWNQFGAPAYEEDNKMNGHSVYYMGNHGLMYKFNYRFSNQRPQQDEDRDIFEITIATEEYMKNHVID